MKPTDILVAVILLQAEILVVGCSINEKKSEPATQEAKLIMAEDSVNEMKIIPLPPADHKEATSKKTVSTRPAKPIISTSKIVRDCDDCGCGGIPAIQENADNIICKVETEAEYPGGAAAWQRFLNRNLRVPQDVIDNEMQGSVVVQFVVDEEGNVSNVEAVSGQDAMCAEMVRVIQKSGKWAPARRGGHSVRSLKTQPFTICLQAEE